MISIRAMVAVLFAAGLVAGATPAIADAQGLGARLKRRAEEAAKRKLEERTERRAGEAADAALDKAECAVPGKDCESGDAAAAGSAASGAGRGSANANGAKPGEGAWKNFDFVPGERVIFAEDFSRDKAGDFPKRLKFASGNIEVVEWQGARFLSTNTFGSRFSIPLPETLPERFTLEFDYSASGGNGMQVYFADPAQGGSHAYADIGTWMGGLRGGGMDAIGKPSGDEFRLKDAVFPVRIMADGEHVKVYMGDTRVANVPNANLGRARAIWFVVPGREDRAAMIGNVRVAAGGRELYDALTAEGRVATQGIYFDTGSDRIRPESTGTLAEIGAMLEAHGDLELTIEGHTDSAGDAAANLALSARRAAAVKAYLVARHGIAPGRLETTGLGATKPVVPNTTAEGRQQNRRVELVKS